jgi:hypothetical protein
MTDRDSTPDRTETDRAVIRALANLETGWASSIQLSWDATEGDDIAGRRVVRAVLGLLTRAGILEHIYARHHGQPTEIIKVDRDALRAYLGNEADNG